jgi:cytochrome c
MASCTAFFLLLTAKESIMFALHKTFRFLLATLLCASLSVSAKPLPEDAVAMVKKASEFIKVNGRDKGLAEFNRADGKFTTGDLYIFVIDQQGTMLAHGTLPRIVGKAVLEMKDADNHYLFKDMLAATSSKTNAWVHYKWPNPGTKAIEAKSTYLERVGDLVIGCGIYQ